jgi:hypothetical protein
MRTKTGYGPGRIAYYLKRDHNLIAVPSTIGHVLKREGLIQSKTKRNYKKHTKRHQMPNPDDLLQMNVKYEPYFIRESNTTSLRPSTIVRADSLPTSILKRVSGQPRIS